MVFAIVQVFRNVCHGSSISILFLLSSLIKGHLDYLCTNQSSDHISLYLLAHLRILDRHVRQPNLLLQKRRRTARGNLPDTLAFDHDLLIVARDATVCDLEANQFPLDAFFFLTRQSFSSNKVAFVQLTNPPEVCLE